MDSCCVAFLLLVDESAVLESYAVGAQFGTHQGKYSGLDWWKLIGISIEKRVHFAAMTMQIQNKSNLSTSEKMSQIFFNMSCLMHIFNLSTLPSSIQIKTIKICPIVTCTNSIRVHHRYYFYLVIFTKILVIFIFWKKCVYHALEDERTWCLTWMLSSHYQDQRSCLGQSWILLLNGP